MTMQTKLTKQQNRRRLYGPCQVLRQRYLDATDRHHSANQQEHRGEVCGAAVGAELQHVAVRRIQYAGASAGRRSHHHGVRVRRALRLEERDD